MLVVSILCPGESKPTKCPTLPSKESLFLYNNTYIVS